MNGGSYVKKKRNRKSFVLIKFKEHVTLTLTHGLSTQFHETVRERLIWAKCIRGTR